MEHLTELKARQDDALGEAWPDNPSPAYRRARERAWRERLERDGRIADRERGDA